MTWKEQNLGEVSNKKKKTLKRGRNMSFSEYEQSKKLEIDKDTLKEKISIYFRFFKFCFFKKYFWQCKIF